ncbi:DUF7738 domain-containing protein [Anaeromyxobacter oryzisoli]|uniref:DUF7738 domain-containing protein n=1 Tax=Anaeromyxobacter oryzisoli TaxID=2925408 RepID=UPI001F58812B|nr:hypothetical protein [Anaeromyxobacter sp. SG63]
MSPPLRRASLALILLLGAACSEPAKPAPVLDERHVITVDGTTVRYNGQLLDWNGTVKDWEKVLGPASRDEEGVATWDDLGFFVFHNRGSPHPTSLAVLFGRSRHSGASEGTPGHWPAVLFRGRLVVDGTPVHPGLALSAMRRDCGTMHFTRGYLPTIYTKSSAGYLLGLEFGHDESLTEFSISAQLPPGGSPQ